MGAFGLGAVRAAEGLLQPGPVLLEVVAADAVQQRGVDAVLLVIAQALAGHVADRVVHLVDHHAPGARLLQLVPAHVALLLAEMLSGLVAALVPVSLHLEDLVGVVVRAGAERAAAGGGRLGGLRFRRGHGGSQSHQAESQQQLHGVVDLSG